VPVKQAELAAAAAQLLSLSAQSQLIRVAFALSFEAYDDAMYMMNKIGILELAYWNWAAYVERSRTPRRSKGS